MVTKLIGRTGPVVGRDFVMPDDMSVVHIGAGKNNEIRIRGNGVSRQHARIVRRADECWLEDAGSSNGTFINGLRVKSERLRHLDVVTLARHVDLIFIRTESPAAAEPMPSGRVNAAVVAVPPGETVDDNVASAEEEESGTRLVWSPTELAEIDKHRARVLSMMEQPPVREPVAKPRTAPPIENRPAPVVSTPAPAIEPTRIAPSAKPATIQAIELLGGENGPVRVGPGMHTIGRGPTADIRVSESDRQVSRVHAVLTVALEGNVAIEGRGMNGTFVNGELVNGSRTLRDGDQVQCGGTMLTVRFVS